MSLSAGAGAGILIGGSPFSTSFAGTENPLVEDGGWIKGGTHGIDWTDPRKTPGLCMSSQVNNTYDDSIAHRTGYNANHWCQGTIFRDPSCPTGETHEIELLLRFNITANSATGYEIDYNSDGGCAIVRWNGALGDFNSGEGNNTLTPVTGDILYAQIIGNVVTVKFNGSTLFTDDITTDFGGVGSVWNTGQPGVGFFIRNVNASSALGFGRELFGFSAFSCGSL